jgi:hypothetical protein
MKHSQKKFLLSLNNLFIKNRQQKFDKIIKYYLGEKYSGNFFSSQEAKHTLHCVKKLTSKKLNILMDIHLRAMKNYQRHFNCKINPDYKRKLIETIKSTNFIEYSKKICQRP